MKPQLFEILLFLRNPSRFLVEKSRIPAEKGLLYAWANEISIILYGLMLWAILSSVTKLAGINLFSAFPARLQFDVSFGLKTVLFLVWAPLYEEGLFRALLNLKKEYIWVSFFLLLFFLQRLFLPPLPNQDSLTYTFFYAGSFAAVGFCVAKIFSTTTDLFIERYLRPNFKWLTYASIIVFGFFHATNFDMIHGSQWLMTPAITIPQLVTGIFLCYVRVNYGLLYAVLLHFLHNMIPLLFGLIIEFGKPYWSLPLLILIIYLIRKLWKQTKGPIEPVVENDTNDLIT